MVLTKQAKMARKSSTSRDVSSTESCGYVTFILSTIFFFVYFLWAFLPDHIVKVIDENYTTYYPPRDLAGYFPAYLALLFVFVPILYMGLNMLSCPAVDSIDGIWDTQSNCHMNEDVHARCAPFLDKGVNYFVPTIFDEDVRSVNLRLRQNMMGNRKRVDDR